jgi:hypothetical protein
MFATRFAQLQLCRLLCLLLCAQGLCNMSLQPAAGCNVQTEVTHRNRHTDVLQHVVLLELLSCGSLPGVLAACTGVYHVKTARQVQPGLFDRLDTSQQIHRCLLICLASRVGHAGRMLLSSAICRLLCLLLCAGFVQHVTAARQVQPGLFDRLDTSQQIHRCLLICLHLV